MKLKSYFSLATLAAVTACLSVHSSAVAQGMVWMTPGQYMRGELAGAVVSAVAATAALAQDNQAIEREIVEARRAFWSSPQGAGKEAAGIRLEEALIRKEVRLAAMSLASFGAMRGSLLDHLVRAAGTHQIDGGISPYCLKRFEAWQRALVEAASEKGATRESAFRSAMPEFASYRAERDLVELLFLNPAGILRSPTPEPELYLAAWLLGTKHTGSIVQANAEAARIAEQVGAVRLKMIVEVLRSWSKITDWVEGPWGANSRLVVNQLVSTTSSERPVETWGDFGANFGEVRGQLMVPGLSQERALDLVEGLWNDARKNQDLVQLRYAINQRDELIARVRLIFSNNPSLYARDGKLTLSLLELKLDFMDYYLRNGQMRVLSRGERNPDADGLIEASAAYLESRYGGLVNKPSAFQQDVGRPAPVAPSPGGRGAVGGRASRGQSVAAPRNARVEAQAVPTPPADASPPASQSAEDVAYNPADPLARIRFIARDPKASPGSPESLSDLLSVLGNEWRNYSSSGSEVARRRLVEHMRMFSTTLTQAITQLQRILDGPWGKVPAQREDSLARIAAMRKLLTEVNLRQADFEKMSGTMESRGY